MEFLNVFASVDKDQDLVIHESDLDNYAAEMKYEKAFKRKWLLLFDQDQDGKITFAEFCETLGLDPKIYEEKLREVRRNLALKQKGTGGDRKEETEETIKPQSSRRIRAAPPTKPKPQPKAEVVEEEVVRPQASRRAQAPPPQQQQEEEKGKKYYVDISDGPEIEFTIIVEYSELEPEQLEKVKKIVTDVEQRFPQMSNSERDRRLTRELDGRLGHGWRSQTNPAVTPKEVNCQENCMAVLLLPESRRVMVWKAEETGGCCCCC